MGLEVPRSRSRGRRPHVVTSGRGVVGHDPRRRAVGRAWSTLPDLDHGRSVVQSFRATLARKSADVRQAAVKTAAPPWGGGSCCRCGRRWARVPAGGATARAGGRALSSALRGEGGPPCLSVRRVSEVRVARSSAVVTVLALVVFALASGPAGGRARGAGGPNSTYDHIGGFRTRRTTGSTWSGSGSRS